MRKIISVKGEKGEKSVKSIGDPSSHRFVAGWGPKAMFNKVMVCREATKDRRGRQPQDRRSH